MQRLSEQNLGQDEPKVHIPYRDSKLTRVLKDSLCDLSSFILLIVTLNPQQEQFDDTFNSLTFANKIKKIKVD